ncbi:MAG: hypoxanthine phosphoribosyltransferase [Dehalococcoidales bacterium]|nr:hypoxanthine phosphoribosyltransferase [Dehalococcoidales bacterium]
MDKSATIIILYTREQIEATVKRLAGEITRDYADKNPLLVGILKGSFMFMADLIRQLDFPLEIEFVRVSSYGKKKQSSGKITVVQGIRTHVKNRHVLVVEDIIDSGLSVNYVLESLRNKKSASLKACCLLDKPARRQVTVPIDYTGLTVPDKFLVGYGLDWAEQYRNLPDICYLEDVKP